MPGYMSFGDCHARVGLLVLRDCGRPGVASCHLCGRSLCLAHQVLTEQGPTCPDCVGQQEQFGGAPTEAAATARSRNQYYDSYGYTPFYTGSSHYYSDRDYRTFDRQPASEVEQASTESVGAEGSWSDEEGPAPGDDDMDSFMES
jgi:hypothetical protein